MSQETFEETGSGKFNADAEAKAKHLRNTPPNMVVSFFFSISLCLLDLYQCWNHCCDDSTGREWQNLALRFCFVLDVVVRLNVCV